jgi:hypothetical protein
MPKHIPLPCSPENCGELFPKCGTANTYSRLKCRCDACSLAKRQISDRHYAKNKTEIIARSRQWQKKNPERVKEGKRRRRQEDPEKHRAADKRQRERNPEKVAESYRKYYYANQEARRQQRIEYYYKNRDVTLEKMREAYALNPEVHREKSRRWRELNPEKAAETDARWHRANIAKVLEKNRRRHARKKAATVVPHTVEQLAQRMAYYGNRCYLNLDGCAGHFEHIEHVKPISKGGAHMLCNLRPSCANCNLRKSAKWPFNI